MPGFFDRVRAPPKMPKAPRVCLAALRPAVFHGCPVEGNRLSATMHSQPKIPMAKIPMAGLDPWAFSPRTLSVGIHVSLGLGDLRGQDVDARNKSGQSVLTVVLWLSSLDPALSRSFNRTAVAVFQQSTTRPLLDIVRRSVTAASNHRLTCNYDNFTVADIRTSHPAWMTPVGDWALRRLSSIFHMRILAKAKISPALGGMVDFTLDTAHHVRNYGYCRGCESGLAWG